MNKKIVTSFVFLLAIIITFSATSEEKFNITQIDSLRKEINNKKGFDKISTQLDLALQVMENDKNDAQVLAKSALFAAKIANKKDMEMRAYFLLGKISEVLNNKDLSEAYYDTALTITEASGDNWSKGEILFRKGVIKQNRSEEIKALEYFNASLQACRLSNNFKTMGSSYSMMGTIFRVNGLYDRAIEYVVNSKLYYEKAGSQEGKAWAAYLLGRIYADLKLSRKALEYFQEALKIYTKMASIDGNKDGEAICYSQIGILYLETGKFNDAHKYIDYTLKIYTDTKSKYGLSNAYKNLGIIDYTLGTYMPSEKYLMESLRIKKEVGDLLGVPSVYEYIENNRLYRGR